jgi:hypothetical protein
VSLPVTPLLARSIPRPPLSWMRFRRIAFPLPAVASRLTPSPALLAIRLP